MDTALKNSNNYIRTKGFLILMSSLIMILLFVRDITNVQCNKIIFVGLVAIAAFQLSRNGLLIFISFLIPLSSGLPGNYIFLILFVAYLWKKRSLSIAQLLIPAYFIVFELILSGVSPNIRILDLIAYVVELSLTLIIILDSSDNGIDYDSAITAYSIGTTFMLLMVVLLSLKNMSLAQLFTGTIRLGDTITEKTNLLQFSIDSNNIGFYAIISISLCLYKINQRKSSVLLHYVLLIVDAVIALTTVSRSFMLVMVIIFVIYFLYTIKPNIKSLSMIAALIFMGYFGVKYLLDYTSIFSAYKARFTASTMATAGGRTVLMKQYFEWQSSRSGRLLFGTGALDYKGVTGFDTSLHNGMQQILLAYGILGSIVMGFAFIAGLVISKKHEQKSFIQYLPLLGFAIYIQTVQLLNPIEYFMSLIICYLPIKANSRETER